MNTEVLHAAIAGSISGAHAFPEVVRMLTQEGVESYRADLVRMEETFYMPSGETHVEALQLATKPIGADFHAAQVIAAIRASQAGSSTYPEFLDRVMTAGTTSYVVYLRGKKAIYFGRNGEFHIEEFPRAR